MLTAVWFLVSLFGLYVAEYNPLYQNLVVFNSEETHCCPICLESYKNDEVVFAMHPKSNIRSGKEELCYSRMHFLHFNCLAGYYIHLNSDCPVCKERIDFLEHFDEQFLASLFQLSAILVIYPSKIAISTVKKTISWMAEAIQEPNEIQQFILNQEIKEIKLIPGVFSNIFSHLKIQPPLSKDKEKTFLRLLIAKQEEIFRLIQLSDKNYIELYKESQFR